MIAKSAQARTSTDTSPRKRTRGGAGAAGIGLWLCLAVLGVRDSRASENFSIDYIVSISPQQPNVARVRWELSGIDEIEYLRLRFPANRFTQFRGSGVLEPTAEGLRWAPAGPYAHLTYQVAIDHARGPGQHYDSYAGADWIVTRAHDLFPRIDVEYRAGRSAKPRSRARLIFRLPSRWHSATVFPEQAADVYALNQPGTTLDRPRGWFVLGKFARDRQEIAEIMVQLARVQDSTLAPQELFAFLSATLPSLRTLLQAPPQTVLIINAPDPMWHGGISAEHSFFMHAKRPLRTPDKTSPYLHELFHVLQPYKPAADADWIEEGLAEFYSLELQRRAGLITAAAYARALGYFERFGRWNVNLTQQQDNAATNNSAPLVMYALDQRIQHATTGKKRLDDVVTRLAKEGGQIDTARFLRTVDAVAGKTFSKFFERHVLHGQPPSHSNVE